MKKDKNLSRNQISDIIGEELLLSDKRIAEILSNENQGRVETLINIQSFFEEDVYKLFPTPKERIALEIGIQKGYDKAAINNKSIDELVKKYLVYCEEVRKNEYHQKSFSKWLRDLLK